MIKFQFDAIGNPIMPSLILARHSGFKIGMIVSPYDETLSDELTGYPELSFTVDKKNEPFWKQILDFKLIYAKEWDTWLQIQVDIVDGDATIKQITCQGLCKSELSQTLIHGLEFNTDDDIARDDYVRRIIYEPDENNKDASILDQLLEKMPHYKIKHVDASIARMQKTFTFDETSVDDAINEICGECHAVAVYNDGTGDDGMPAREISLYDLETICQNCGHRGEFSDICPECGSTNLKYGYGTDTTIFISKQNLTNEVKYTTDVDSVKNTFKLQAGDDIMTSAIQACNPSGTDYIHYFNKEIKEDMPEELAQKIDEYDDEYRYYQKEHVITLDPSLVEKYNETVQKYNEYRQEDEEFSEIVDGNIIGYPALMNVLYDIIDFNQYLESGLMPGDTAKATAEQEAAKLTVEAIGPIAAEDNHNDSISIMTGLVLDIARFLVDKRFNVTINEDYESHFITDGDVKKIVTQIAVTDYGGDETITAYSPILSIAIQQNTELYIKQRIKKVIAATDDQQSFSMSELLETETPIENFEDKLKPYNIEMLHSLKDTCMTCMDTLQTSGVADKTHELYDGLYLNYYNKLQLILDEITAKEEERDDIVGGLLDFVIEQRNDIQEHLNFQNYLGKDLYKIFCYYRREDIYRNENYISDGLNNAQIFENAREFYRTAEKEIYKSAVLQHSITATLKNLLVIPEFAPLRDYFKLGNWLRIDVDGEVFRLRLIRYEIDFGELSEVNVEFSDVTRTADGLSDIGDLLNRTVSMATSYGAVVHQMNATKDAKRQVDSWIKDGFDATLTKIVDDNGRQDVVIDNHGILIRDYDDVTETYGDTQMKFINSILAITDDGWKSIRTALGNITYRDPDTGDYHDAYGLIAETIVGDLILGRTLKIHNTANNLRFDENGLWVQGQNQEHTFSVTPNGPELLAVTTYGEKIFYLDENGMLHITGDGSGLDINSNSSITNLRTQFQVTAGEIIAKINNENAGLESKIQQTADRITLNINNVNEALSSQIQMTANRIRSDVSDSVNDLYSYIDQTAEGVTIGAKDDLHQLEAYLLVTADAIRSEANDYQGRFNSAITQTKKEILSEVNDTKNDLHSYFTQRADQIESQVINNQKETFSRITQTDSEIRTIVANEVAQINSQIVQKENEIMSTVTNNVDNLSSMIYQNDHEIKLMVQNGIDELQSSITINADQIQLLVGETSKIIQTLNNITLSVGDSSIELTDRMINAVAEQINLKGLITIDGLHQQVRTKFDLLEHDIDRIDVGLGKVITDEDVKELIYTQSGHSVYYHKLAPNDPELEDEYKRISYNVGDIWWQEFIDNSTNNSKMICWMYNGDNHWVQKTDGQVVIQNGTVMADMISADAISADKFAGNVLASLNYQADTSQNNTVGYAGSGMLINLSGGGIQTKNFVVKNTNENGGGEVYVRGTIYATSLELGDNVTIPSDKVNVDWEHLVDVSGFASKEELQAAVDDIMDNMPDYISEEDVADVIAHYNDNLSAGQKLVFGSAVSHDVVTEGNVKYDVITVNGVQTYKKIYHDDSDFVLLERPIIEKDENGDDKERGEENVHYVAISKQGLLEADNAIIHGTIYATDGEFSGTLKAAEIICPQGFSSETILSYKAIDDHDYGIIHQLINDSAGTLYRATLGSAGILYLPQDIHFQYSSTYPQNGNYTKYLGRGDANGGGNLSDIIADIYKAIGTGGGSVDFSGYLYKYENHDTDGYFVFKYNENTSSPSVYIPTCSVVTENNVSKISLDNLYSITVSSQYYYHSYSGEDLGIVHQLINDSGTNHTRHIASLDASGHLYVNNNEVALQNNFNVSDGSNINVTISNLAYLNVSSYNSNLQYVNVVSSGVYGYKFATEVHQHQYLYDGGNTSNNNVFVHDGGQAFSSNGTGIMSCGSSGHLWSTVFAQNGTINTSDERKKDIIGHFTNKHKELFMQINPICFTWKDNDNDRTIHWGIGAQSFEKIAKSLDFDNLNVIDYDQNTDSYGFRYSEAQMLAWYVTQENTHDIESLQTKLDYMEKENNMLKKYISELADKVDQLSNKLKGR